ncbi:MAG: hypothetical protein K2H74_06000, partial [Paramuribaculum sp.]|nr:hypothetical protein [Paramuribaculum sp.]
MKKFLRSLIAIVACGAMTVGCSDSDSTTPGSNVDPSTNYWSFNGGQKVAAGSVMIYETADHVTVLVSPKSGLTSVMDFDATDDCTQITFPVSAIGTTIDLANLTEDDEEVMFTSGLDGFGKYNLTVDCDKKTVSEGTITSSLNGDNMALTCDLTTLEGGVKFSLHLLAPYRKADVNRVEGSSIEYTVESRDIAESNTFRSAFYYKNSWNDGWTFTFSVSGIGTYQQLGSNAYIEIYAGAEQLLNGEAFNVATTPYPFSFKIEYLDRQNGTTVPVTIDNSNRKGAAGYITLTKNDQGLYDAHFNVTLNSGDITVSGYYVGEMQPRNTIYNNADGVVAPLRSATLDLSSNPRILYLSTKPGTAGPDQYDIKGEVPAEEWRYGKFMAFSGQGSAITWIDGVTYSKQATPGIGGNWRVMQPTALPGNIYVAEC